MDNNQIQNRIKEALALRGMKQVELSEKAKVNKGTLNHWTKRTR